MLKRLLAAAAALVGVGLSQPALAGPLDYAVIITNKGYASYKHTHDVKYAHEDGKAFKRALIEVFKVPETRIIEIQDASLGRLHEHFGNPKAREGTIYDFLKHPKGRLFVYYSGHGVPGFTRSDPNTPKPYLLPVDSNPQLVASSGYSLDDLVNRLREIKTERLFEGEVLLFLEACFSGVSPAGAILDKSSGTAFNPVLPASSGASSDIFILAASRSDEIASWDDKAKLGVFTNALLDGIYGLADQDMWKGNGDRKLTLGELRRFTESRMSDRLRQLYKGATRRQSPTFTGTDTATLVEYAASTYPVRDARVMTEEETQCRILKSSTDRTRISKFLEDCDYCLCRADLEKQVAKLDVDLQFCDSEREAAGRLYGEGNLDELGTLISGARCAAIKTEFVAKVDELKRTCADERKLFEDMRQKRALDRMRTWVARSSSCASVRNEARRYVDGQTQACERAGKQFAEVKAAGDPETLRRFARFADCESIKVDANREADDLDRICVTDLTLLKRHMLDKRDHMVTNMSNMSKCGEVRERAKKFLEALEARCGTDATAWEPLKTSKDLVALRKVLANAECPRVRTEIERRIGVVEE
ncbi:MAG TPA: caspase family protein, partial [Hyphomicrobiaceae bacterium]|nr:caspase family protein [Hyphomicrobiaceae bacterium]